MMIRLWLRRACSENPRSIVLYALVFPKIAADSKGMQTGGPAARNLDNDLAELDNLKEEFNERVVAYRSKVAQFNSWKSIYQRNYLAYDNQINTNKRNANIARMAPRKKQLQAYQQSLANESNELIAMQDHIDSFERTIGSQFKVETSPFWMRGKSLPPLKSQPMQPQPMQPMQSQPMQPQAQLVEPKSYPDLLCPSINDFKKEGPKAYKELAPVIKKLKSYARPELTEEIKALEALKPGWFKSPNISRASGPLQALSTKLSCDKQFASGSKQRVSRYCDSISKLIDKPMLTYSNIERSGDIIDIEDSYPANIAALRKLKPGFFSKPTAEKLKVPLTKLYNKLGCGWRGTAKAEEPKRPEEVFAPKNYAPVGSGANTGATFMRTAQKLAANAVIAAAPGYQQHIMSQTPVTRNSQMLGVHWPNMPEPGKSSQPLATFHGGARLSARRTRKAGSRSRSASRSRSTSRRGTKRNARLNKRSHKRRRC